jgi:hypothetical protein
MGPIGSGKSVACCIEVALRAMAQEPCSDNVRRTRWAVIRNTFPELKSTTIKTWQDWFDESICPMRYDSPITGNLKFNLPDGTTVDSEVLFIALDKPKDIKKLLSLELTGAWINEAREIPKIVVDGVSSRIGRYPSKSMAPLTWSGFFMDTNPPDDDHWWYKFAEEGAWRVDSDLPDIEEIKQYVPEDAIDSLLKSMHSIEDRKGEMVWSFYRQPPALLKIGDKAYIPNPDAENVNNQPLGYMYWFRQLSGKDPDWVKVYILGEYGSLFTGRPVYQGVWDDKIHCAKESLAVYSGLPLRFAWDFGLTPACCVGQLSPNGQLRILREYICERGGIREFANEVVRPAVLNEFPGMKWATGRADPAGMQASQVDEVTCIGELNRLGFPTEAAVTNDFIPRRQAVTSFLTRKDGFLLDPSCKVLRKGFNGGYQYSRIQASGEERFKDVPNKNMFSHVHDAMQYFCLSVDESYSMKQVVNRPAISARNEWSGFV